MRYGFYKDGDKIKYRSLPKEILKKAIKKSNKKFKKLYKRLANEKNG